MDSCRADAEGGFNAFVKAQAVLPGEALLTLVQFDTEYDFVHRGVPVKVVPPYTLVLRGGTALYDAVGRVILETGTRLAACRKSSVRAGAVCRYYRRRGELQPRNLRRSLEGDNRASDRKYAWQFTYLGTNQNAIMAAAQMGITPGAAMNYAVINSGVAFENLSASFMRRRTAAAGDPATDLSFTEGAHVLDGGCRERREQQPCARNTAGPQVKVAYRKYATLAFSFRNQRYAQLQY